jgi:transposase
LLRHGYREAANKEGWSVNYYSYLRGLCFSQTAWEETFTDYLHEVEHMTERVRRLEQVLESTVPELDGESRAIIGVLQGLRGVGQLTALTLLAEIGRFSRFCRAPQLMSFSGIVPSEYSSGGPERVRRGGITKSGNAHLRRVLCEAAWHYRHRPRLSVALRRRQSELSQEVKDLAWRAQHRLYRKYYRLSLRGKPHQKAVTAVARELLGFIWALAVQVEKQACPSTTSVAAAA